LRAERRLSILDTTLRDGDQAAGFAFSPGVKLKLGFALAEAGVDIIETGFPLASGADFEVCRLLAKELGPRGTTAVMCRGRLEDIRKSAAVFEGGLPGMLHISLPASRIHIKAKLGKTPEEMLTLLHETVSYAAGLVSRVEIGAEDASRADRGFLADYCGTAIRSGAEIVNIADTLGMLCPSETGDLVGFLLAQNPVFASSSAKGAPVLSIHCHNDLGLACANTLAAVEAGCSQVEVSVSGIGERAGNAALEEVAANLLMRTAHYGVCTGIDFTKLPALLDLAAASGTAGSLMKPLNGWNVRAHSSGIHQQGLSQNTETYAPGNFPAMVPERIVLSRHSGIAGAALFCRHYCAMEPDRETLFRIMDRIKNSPCFASGAVGLSEFIALLGEMEKLPPAYTGPLLIDTWRFVRDGRTAAAEFQASLKPAFSSEPALEAAGQGETWTAAVLAALNRLGEMTLGEAKRQASGGQAPEGIELQKLYINGSPEKIRLYAVSVVRGRPYPLERSGTDAELLLFQCGLDGINAELLREMQ
jgi:2-isopropylmalate synthase